MIKKLADAALNLAQNAIDGGDLRQRNEALKIQNGRLASEIMRLDASFQKDWDALRKDRNSCAERADALEGKVVRVRGWLLISVEQKEKFVTWPRLQELADILGGES